MENNFYPEKKGVGMFSFLLAVVLAFVIGWQGSVLGWYGELEENGEKMVEVDHPLQPEDVDLDLMWTVWNELQRRYFDEADLNQEEQMYGAIKGLVDSLEDPYTVFMTPKETQDFKASLEGELEGIGAELTVEEGVLTVVSPLKQSPAEKAGLLPGDVIFEIDGELAAEMTLFDAIMNIRGEKGTTVVLTIIRDGVDEPFDLSIVRDHIEIESVTVEELEGGITYLAVNQFNDRTNVEFGQAISEMLLEEPEGLIVDLRFNGGGYLDIAVELLSYLLPEGSDAVIIKERGKADEVIKTNGNPKLLNVPLVVLVNGASASASEIFAGAIQDHERGIVMGEQTFGKGSVQEVETFIDASSMRITIAKWYTPSDRGIDEVGLLPDVIVELSDEDRENEYDRQKEEAAQYLRDL